MTTSGSSNVSLPWSSGSSRPGGCQSATASRSARSRRADDEKLGEITREPLGSEVAPVGIDTLQEALEDANVRREVVVEALGQVGVVKRRPVDRRADVRGGRHVVTGDEVHVEAVVVAFHVRVFGVLLVAVGEDGVPDFESVLLQRFAVDDGGKQPNTSTSRSPAATSLAPSSRPAPLPPRLEGQR